MLNLVDMHCDTISRLMEPERKETLKQNSLNINEEGLVKAGTLVQFFACFVSAAVYEKNKTADNMGKQPKVVSPEAWEGAYQAVLKMVERMDQEQSEKIKVVHSYQEIMDNKKQDIISAIKTVEEGGVIAGQLSRLDILYHAGIRLITLTWNYENCLGYPNSRDKNIMTKGLKHLGIQTVERMNQLGMLVDVSHLSDGGFWDCMKISKAPICASHSNARAICNHPRNLSDEMIRALGESGGVAGLNFYPAFLCESRKAVLDDIARHAAYMIRTGGEDVVAIGTDFDGFDNEVRNQWIGHVKDMEHVWIAMKKQGISERQIEKIMGDNALRVIKEAIS